MVCLTATLALDTSGGGKESDIWRTTGGISRGTAVLWVPKPLGKMIEGVDRSTVQRKELSDKVGLTIRFPTSYMCVISVFLCKLRV
jgi:hypothetical protein